jgi:hypothetical protein
MTSAYDALSSDRGTHGAPNDESSSQGHAATLLGYHDAHELFLVEDSRGVDFAVDGYWELPYALFESRLVFEAWTLRRISYNT